MCALDRWLDWNREYRGWQQAGMWVDVSYQFTAKTQPPSSWPDAYLTSKTLGYKFGRAFGRTSGAGTVASFEAGNEPCECRLICDPFCEGTT
jgi:hypothetical protein